MAMPTRGRARGRGRPLLPLNIPLPPETDAERERRCIERWNLAAANLHELPAPEVREPVEGQPRVRARAPSPVLDEHFNFEDSDDDSNLPFRIVPANLVKKGVKTLLEDIRFSIVDPDESVLIAVFIPDIPEDRPVNMPFRHEFIAGTVTERAGVVRDDHFYQLSREEGWIYQRDNDLVVMDMAKYCVEQMIKPKFKIYQVSKIPEPELLNLKVPDKSMCHVIRCKDPSDFHIILLENPDWFDLDVHNRRWTHFFKKREVKIAHRKDKDSNPKKSDFELHVNANYCFKTPAEAYVGMKLILAAFINHVRDPGVMERRDELMAVIARTNYCVGDLVVLEKPEEAKRKGNVSTTCTAGYRGVIIEPVFISPAVADDPDTRNEYLVVYLLDTGEVRITEKECLFPLPRAFVGFRPLAIRCSLANVAPDEGEEWSEAARLAFKGMIEKGPFRGKLYPRKPYRRPDEFRSSLTLQFLDQAANGEPYLVDLKDQEKFKDVGISLITKDLANINIRRD